MVFNIYKNAIQEQMEVSIVMGVPLVIIHFRLGLPMKKNNHFWGFAI